MANEMGSLVHYVCAAAAHASARPDSRGDLTVHEGRWAFCPAEARGGHEWRDVGGVAVADLGRYGLRRPLRA